MYTKRYNFQFIEFTNSLSSLVGNVNTLIRIILYCFSFLASYEKARKKLKDAEDLSDINSCTETENYLKETRKIRAAKAKSDSSNSSDELDELSEMDELLKNIPKIPEKQITTHSEIRKVMRKSKNRMI